MKICANLLLYQGSVVNKYNFEEYLPIGSLQYALKRLDEWQIDEIIILNKSHSSNVKDDLNWLSQVLSKVNQFCTPWAYGGGIKTIEDVKNIINFGFERVVVTSKTILQSRLLEEIYSIWGEQAVIAHIPYYCKNQTIFIKSENDIIRIEDLFDHKLKAFKGEILLTSVESEGRRRVNFEEIHYVKSKLQKNTNIIYSGGIYDESDISNLADMDLSGIVLGNIVNAKELFVPRIKLEHEGKFREYIENNL